ncbi:hypothetical protein [Curtobacterium sp. PhB115]|uniref:hypothetical protein n=1 Tax=Curtobacterium sp. PhB115 TaxID=2485173 RepID=UPI000FA48E54|nr:hypothetical protein [Curtobacterium sp. PhB115]ROP74793.1 hypothetical protein EDF19_0880 [Curtobacterium sp. PhB115]
MSTAAVATAGDSGARIPGSDRIGTTALVRTAQAVAAESLRVAFREVRARVADDGRGALAVEITAPLTLPVLGSHAVPDEPVVTTAHRARATIADRVRTITGRQVSRVTVTFASSVVDVPRRVR